MRRVLTLLAICSTLSVSLHAQDHVRPASISAHTRFLADDLLLGRGTGSAGARLAALYIESQCRALGLAPVEGSYRQPVLLDEASVLPSTAMSLTRRGAAVEFLYPFDFVPNVGSYASVRSFAGPAVFVGSEQDVLRGLPNELALDGGVAVSVEPLRGAAVDTLVRRGVVGMVHLVPEPPNYELYVRSRGPSRLYHRDPTVVSSFLPAVPSVIAGPRVVAALTDGLAFTPSGEVPPQRLGWEVAVRIDVSVQPVNEENVVCVLSGTDPTARDTAVALSAHYDHLGISVPDASGDSIYNGFSDNAAGVGMLLGIAEALARPDARPRHSVLFLFFTGEERGLLGSDAYVAAPAWPLGRTLALINLDAGAPPARPVSWRLAGVDSTGLGASARRVADRNGWAISTSGARANSDYFPFHRSGVPSVFVIPGSGAYDGLSADSSAALRRRWDRYHQASDAWDPDFPFDGLARYADFALSLVREADAAGVR